MTRGRGKNGPDRSGLMTAQGVEIIDANPIQCPSYLPPDATRLWIQLTRQSSLLQMLKEEDALVLESLCMQYQVWTDAKNGYLLLPPSTRTREETFNGFKRNSDIDVMDKAFDRIIKASKMLGISPLVRSQMNLNNAVAVNALASAFPGEIASLYRAAKNGKD
ncbi:MAG: hypothetical protein HGA54_01650 [Actinobacteria bacterium]|nr:hypothetical protein [Actinomycetota bacterium]